MKSPCQQSTNGQNTLESQDGHVKVLLLENVHPMAAEAHRRAGFDVEVRAGAMTERELIEAVAGVSLLGIRSNTSAFRIADSA